MIDVYERQLGVYRYTVILLRFEGTQYGIKKVHIIKKKDTICANRAKRRPKHIIAGTYSCQKCETMKL